MEQGSQALDLKLEVPDAVPASDDPSKRVIYQDKMADQDAPQRYVSHSVLLDTTFLTSF